MPKMLKKFEVEDYMDGWMYNVGAPYGVRHALISAFRDSVSLKNWFGTDDVDYNEEHALEYMKKYEKD